MAKKYSTKRALIASVLMLALCFSMLVGTTFAWFTDSVTSGSNVIQAGNLDIVLEYWDGSEWKDAEGKVLEFVKASNSGEPVLWEPGCTYHLPKIRVRNVGSLSANILIRLNGVTGDEKLMEVIDLTTTVTNIPDTILTGSQASIYQKYENATVPVLFGTPDGTVIFDWGLMGKGVVSPNSGHTDTSAEFTITGHMQASAGNEYQDLKIEGVSITVLATQLNFEYDSFNRDYDLGAPFPAASALEKLPEDAADAKDTELKTSGATVNIPADAIKNIIGNTTAEGVAIKHTSPIIDKANKKVTFESFELVDEKGKIIYLEAINNTEPVSVKLDLKGAFAPGEGVVIYHDDEIIASSVVDADGYITYAVTHFCEIVLSKGDGTIDTAAELSAALAEGGTVTLDSDIALTGSIVIPEGVKVALDLNGKTISGGNNMSVLRQGMIVNNGDLTLTGGGELKITVDNAYSVIDNYGKLTVNDVTVNSTNYDGTNGVPMYAIRSMNELTVNEGAVVKGLRVITVNSGVATFNGGEITAVASENVLTVHTVYVYGSSSATFNGGTFKNLIPASYASAGGAATICDATTGEIVINGGYYESTVSDYLTLHDYGMGGPTILVKGGTFKFKPAANKIAANHNLTENADGTWSVTAREGTAVGSWEELKAALPAGGYVYLTGNVTASPKETITVPKDVTATLDLNGYTFTADPATVAIDIKSNVTVKGGAIVLNAPADSSTGAGVIGVYNNAALTLENVKMTIDGGLTHGITLQNGTLNLNEGTVITVKGSGFQTGVISFGNDVININGAKIVIAAPADSTTTVGIGSYGTLTVNASSGEITVCDGSAHYGVAPYFGGSVTVILSDAFAKAAEGNGIIFESDVTVK